MRIRSIKPEFWRSPDISTLGIAERLLFIGLWSYVDDNGVGEDRVSTIAADLFADDLSRDPHEALARVTEGLSRLAEAGRIVRYEVDSKPFLFITNWTAHQRIDHPKAPRFPLPTSENALREATLATPSREPREALAPGTGEQGNRGTGEQPSLIPAPPARKPRAAAASQRGTRVADDFAVDDAMRRWAATEVPGLDLRWHTEQFLDYWRGKTGKDSTKLDWVGTWRKWMRTEYQRNGPRKTTNVYSRPGERKANYA